MVATASSCEPPAKTSSDMAQVITSESPPARASTPYERPIIPVVAANVSAARQGLVAAAIGLS